MRSRVVTARRATTVAAAVAAAGAGAALLTHAAPAGSKAAEGGLALSPVVIEQTAKAGTATSITVSNHSATSLAVTVAARPWRQSVTGAAEPNRRATLRGVALGTQSFPLAARTERTLTVTLASLPSTGSLYGALEVVGLPPGAAAKTGIVTGYRLIGTLRYDPAVAQLRLGAGKVTTTGSGAARTLALPVTNRGNTVKPVTGNVDLKGPLGTKNSDIKAVRILPGKTVDVPLQPTRGLVAGAYKAAIELDQGDLTAKFSRSARVKR